MAKSANQRGLQSKVFAPGHSLADTKYDKGAPGSPGAGPASAAGGSLRSTPNKVWAGKAPARSSK
jgi:hypothetical protein